MSIKLDFLILTPDEYQVRREVPTKTWHSNIMFSPHVTVKWSACLLHIQEVLGSNLSSDTTYPAGCL
jgi:hypothetical protein